MFLRSVIKTVFLPFFQALCFSSISSNIFIPCAQIARRPICHGPHRNPSRKGKTTWIDVAGIKYLYISVSLLAGHLLVYPSHITLVPHISVGMIPSRHAHWCANFFYFRQYYYCTISINSSGTVMRDAPDENTSSITFQYLWLQWITSTWTRIIAVESYLSCGWFLSNSATVGIIDRVQCATVRKFHAENIASRY